MSELICCRRCDEPTCRGCNLYTLANALTLGRFDGLMDEYHAVHINADLQKHKHGKWERQNDGIMIWWECSECHHDAWYDEEDLTNFCPNCGADMRESEGK